MLMRCAIAFCVIFLPVAAAQEKEPPVRRTPAFNRFYHALQDAYAHDTRKKDGIGPYRITRAFWQECFSRGDYEDCRNDEYAKQVLERWWRRFYPDDLERCQHADTAGAFEVLCRTAYSGRRGETSNDSLWFWKDVQRRFPLESNEP